MRPTRGLLLGLLALAVVGHAAAQSGYPQRPVRVVVGFPSGSAPDIVARLLVLRLSDAMEKPFLVENVAGAAGNIAAERVAKSSPDGHALGFATVAQMSINPSLYKVSFDPLRDFAPISQVYASPNILVVENGLKVNGVRELVALAKSQPGTLTFASAGSGSTPHLAAEMFKSMAGVDIRHIPYSGGAAAIQDMLGGRVTMMFTPIPVVLPLVREGRLHALATTSLKRAPTIPELPTVDESGVKGFEVTNWGGVVAPAGAAAAIIRKLHLEIVKALALADMREKFAGLGVVAIGSSPDEFAATMRAESDHWAKVIREAKISAD